MTDHIHAMNQLKVPRIQHTTLCVGAFVCACVRVRACVCGCECVAFADYEKAFDSVQTQSILTTLQEHGIEDVYIEILEDIE